MTKILGKCPLGIKLGRVTRGAYGPLLKIPKKFPLGLKLGRVTRVGAYGPLPEILGKCPLGLKLLALGGYGPLD